MSSFHAWYRLSKATVPLVVFAMLCAGCVATDQGGSRSPGQTGVQASSAASSKFNGRWAREANALATIMRNDEGVIAISVNDRAGAIYSRNRNGQTHELRARVTQISESRITLEGLNPRGVLVVYTCDMPANQDKDLTCLLQIGSSSFRGQFVRES